MTKQEMIKSFANAPVRCKQQCPYQRQCNHGDFCIFKEAALIMSADETRISELQTQIQALRDIQALTLNYAQYMEGQCYDYYDMIKCYNGGVEPKLYIPPKRRLATQRLRRSLKKKRKKPPLADVELMDGNPDYAMRFSPDEDKLSYYLKPEII